MNQNERHSTESPLTVSGLTTHIVSLFERDDQLRDLWVVGEVSNWKRAASGHAYFSVKDSGATINAVMWRGNAASHGWLPESGDQILAHGYVGVYPERGAYQLYVNRIRPAGRGQLYAQFEELKARLAAQGLFDPERKRHVPSIPQRIGVVTSADAAALRDILRVLSMRWPLAEVILFPTLVQGADAASQIVQAIHAANRFSVQQETLDVLILARGGGSIEDLWSFNDEGVAQAIAQSELPIITGIGHETDFTIADFVADLRAPTPSVAAAAATPDRAEILDRFLGVYMEITRNATRRIEEQQMNLAERCAHLRRLHPARRLDLRRQQIDDRARRLRSSVRHLLQRLTERNGAADMRLHALNPQSILHRGYSIVQREDGQVVRSPDGLLPNEALSVQTAEGRYVVRVDGADRIG